MHGILFRQLKGYVESEHGEDVWSAAIDEAGIEPKLYLPVTQYPDDEAEQLVDGVVAATDTREQRLLAEFGEFLAPALLDTFKAHVRENWDAMDLLEQSGNEVFAVLRSADGGAEEVRARRAGADTVVVEYGSPLEMCALAEGVLRGIADEHGESVTVEQTQCMHDGAEWCEIRVQRT